MKAKLKEFKELLKEYTLDPTFLNYGKYAHFTKPHQFSPTYRGVNFEYSITSSFLEYCTKSIDNAKEIYLPAKLAVNKHLKSAKFQKAFFNKFNAVTLEMCIYSDDLINHTFGGNWWTDIKSDLYFSINNWFTPEFKEEYKRLQKKGDELIQSGKITHYDIKPVFKELHFLPCEFEELLKLPFENQNKTSVSTMMYQARRFSKHSEQKPTAYKRFKEVTLKSTGRKLLYDPKSEYCFLWYEIDPVIK